MDLNRRELPEYRQPPWPHPLGAQKVKMTLPKGRRVTRVELLRAERQIPFVGGSGTVEFTIPRVVDYEVAVVY